MSNDNKFINGLMFKPPHENAPDYVLAKGSIKREELIAWLQSESGEWINFDLKESQQGKYYASVDDWKPDSNRGGTQRQERPQRDPAPTQKAPAQDDFADDDIPF